MGYYRKFISSSQSNTKSTKTNRKLLAFIACFLIAVALWVVIALNKNYKSTITFYIKVPGQKLASKVTATIYGEGFDLMKEKLLRGRLGVTANNSRRIETEELIRENLELNDGLKYSNFKPAILEPGKAE